MEGLLRTPTGEILNVNAKINPRCGKPIETIKTQRWVQPYVARFVNS
jgi:hypothetical protein